MAAEESSSREEAIKNGSAKQIGNEGEGGAAASRSLGSWESEGMRTYKRRKLAKPSSGSRSAEVGKRSAEGVVQFSDQGMLKSGGRILKNISYEEFDLSRKECTGKADGLDHLPVWHSRNIMLKQMQDLLNGSDGGLLGCIHDAIVYNANKYRVNDVQTTLCCNGGGGSSPIMSNGPLHEESLQTNTKICQRAFFSVIMSEKFASLCQLLHENFQGFKVDGLFDIALINSRMIEGAYELSPELFSDDINKVWGKFEKIGSAMMSLSKSLSEISRGSCSQSTRESDCPLIAEHTEACGVYKVGTCRRCGVRADGKDCLVCDSCEEMYHVSCTEPPVVGIPSSWYCVRCTAKGIGSPHKDCVLCERLNPNFVINEVEEVSVRTAEVLNGVEKSQHDTVENGTSPAAGGETDLNCSICECQVEKGETYVVCSHPFCYMKCYHVRCLTSKQLKLRGPRWYCPSCLCRECLADRDDNRIVMCDSCNHAYHLYCMDPPRTSVPTGSWFCKNCAAAIQRIRKAKSEYLKLEKKRRWEIEDELACKNLDGSETDFGQDESDKAEGVNMLLDAAKTLKYEDELAAVQMKG